MIEGITYILKNDSQVKVIVGKNKADDKFKVYPVVCPEPEQYKYIVVQETSYLPEDCKDGRPTTFNASFDVLCYVKNYDDLISIVDAVMGALDRVSGTHNGVDFDEIRYVNRQDRFSNDQQLYVKIVSFNAIVNEG